MAIQISIIGVNKDGKQIDEVFGDIDTALDFLENLKENYEH